MVVTRMSLVLADDRHCIQLLMPNIKVGSKVTEPQLAKSCHSQRTSLVVQ